MCVCLQRMSGAPGGRAARLRGRLPPVFCLWTIHLFTRETRFFQTHEHDDGLYFRVEALPCLCVSKHNLPSGPTEALFRRTPPFPQRGWGSRRVSDTSRVEPWIEQGRRNGLKGYPLLADYHPHPENRGRDINGLVLARAAGVGAEL